VKVSTTHKPISTTVLISMTDVVFLLLLFLMIASNFVTQAGIPVRLPGSSSAVKQSGAIINIVYAGVNDISINNMHLSLAEFSRQLPGFRSGKEQTVRLFAGKGTTLQELISLMDIIRQTGFEKISIATIRQTQKRK